MSDDMAFAEGCYRLADGEWQVITAYKANGFHTLGVRNGVRWASGVTGMNIVMPDESKINAPTLLEIMSATLGVDDWCEVKGPDSMHLR
ncbi:MULTISPECIES: hypothetical protein [Sphingomonas]|uniref:hypothetical protein n=1 Tax=Sphingomonas TaxID=13687 RepID=UPI001269C0A8|nr:MULTISPECIES: hypothetical protein [Sphingomonas]